MVNIASGKRGKKNIEKRLYILKYLTEHPCVDCGEKDPVVLEFDHIDPSLKEHTIGRLIGSGYNLDDIAKEIDKCVVRCANCHRRRTSRDWDSYRLLSVTSLEKMVGKMKSRADCKNGAKLSIVVAGEIRQRYATGTIGYKKLAKEYGVSKSTIRDIVHRKHYK